MMPFAAKWIATGFGSGLFPRGPGTAGSLAATAIWIALHFTFPGSRQAVNVICLAASVVAGLWATRIYLSFPRERRGRKPEDPGEVVVDEWAGMFVALSFVSPDSLPGITAAFVFFRLFDIIKPYPVSRLERLPGAVGIMADDLMAGLLAGLCSFAGLMLYDLF